MAYQAIPGFQGMNSQFGDTTYTKVFVGGLAWETRSETLRRHFEQFGDILEAVVISDKNSGRSKGYGFVTFRDPESARRACADPSPVIDGRRANCNLASLGRPRPSFPFGRLRPASPYFGSAQTPRSTYSGSPGHQQPVPYSYQSGFAYPPYGYTAYGPEYVYSQGAYNPYVGQHYLQLYGLPGAVNANMYPYGQLRPLQGSHGYTTVQGYGMPNHHVVKFGRPNVTGATTATIQAPHLTGIAAPTPGQAHVIVSAHSPQFTQGSSSDQTSG